MTVEGYFANMNRLCKKLGYDAGKVSTMGTGVPMKILQSNKLHMKVSELQQSLLRERKAIQVVLVTKPFIMP